MQIGLTNQIVDDSDSKLSYFDRRFQSDSDSNDVFESMIAISIIIDLFLIYYQLKLIFFDTLLIKRSILINQISINLSKTMIYIENDDIYRKN